MGYVGITREGVCIGWQKVGDDVTPRCLNYLPEGGFLWG